MLQRFVVDLSLIKRNVNPIILFPVAESKVKTYLGDQQQTQNTTCDTFKNLDKY